MYEFSKEEIEAAKERKELILKIGTNQEKIDYMAGEICMYAEMKANEAKTSDERVGCPKCGCNKMTGDGSKSWCLNEECDFIEAD